MANFPADGAYQVLATLSQGAESYRIFAELFIEGSNSHLRFHRFGGDRDDTGLAARKWQVHITRPQLQSLQVPLTGVHYSLSSPVLLDEAVATAVFGFFLPTAVHAITLS